MNRITYGFRRFIVSVVNRWGFVKKSGVFVSPSVVFCFMGDGLINAKAFVLSKKGKVLVDQTDMVIACWGIEIDRFAVVSWVVEAFVKLNNVNWVAGIVFSDVSFEIPSNAVVMDAANTQMGIQLALQICERSIVYKEKMLVVSCDIIKRKGFRLLDNLLVKGIDGTINVFVYRAPQKGTRNSASLK